MNKNTYSVYKKESFSDRLTMNARKKMYNLINRKLPLHKFKTILDVGVTSDSEMISSNYFEKMYPFPYRITAFSDQDASWLKEEYKGMKFIQGDALNMAIPDNTFDFVFSSAVIEHVGNREKQLKFIKESFRVAKKYVCITTPNRWFPIELHTALPFIHWFPPKITRKILQVFKKEFFSKEENLNLLDKKTLKKMLEKYNIDNYEITGIRTLMFRSNLILIIKKQ